jgi:pimeloyl-ACP methyl ester carboxylesterase
LLHVRATLLEVKRLIRPLAAGAGITGALAAINRGLRTGPLPANSLGGTQRRWTWRGYEIFVTEAGEGSPVMLVHGIYPGASTFEYRKLFELLAQRHRVIAFDLLGCGLSDHPNLGYSAELFTEQIVDAAAELAGAPVTIVGSMLGAAFAIRAAARARDRVHGLVAIAPAGLNGILDDEPHFARTTMTTAFRAALLGESIFNALVSRPALRWYLENRVYADAHSATKEVVDHYYAVAHQPGARFVPAYLIGGGLNCNVARDLPFVEAPLLVAWGEQASSDAPLASAGEFVKLAQRARLVTFPQSGLLPQEEEPEAMRNAIEDFLAATGG